MPYSGPNDKELPPNVKAMPEPKRRKWVNVWNKTFANCRKGSVGGGQGSVEDCEKAAFKFANGAVKELNMEQLTEQEKKELAEVIGELEAEKCAECEGGAGEKCDQCRPSVVEVAPAPLAGATTFADADEYDEAQEIEGYAYRLESRFRAIVDNIFSTDATLAEKANKVKAAAGEMEERLGKPPEPQNWFGRAKERLGEALGLDEKATKREDVKDFPASDYAYVPDATKPSTWKLRLTKTPGGGPDAGIVGAAIAALGKGFRGQKVSIPAADLAGVKAKVRAAWKKANPDKKPEDMPATIKEAVGAFRAFKDAEGKWRWLTLTTNVFRDRDGEIFPGAAHEDYVAYADRTKDMPELRVWHVPGSRIGQADWLDYAHGFVVHSGSFDKGMEDVAESLSKEAQGVSHGFYHDKEAESDTYPWYRDFEISVLPPEKAANQWTEFTAENAKEVVMGLSKEKRDYLVEHMTEDRVATLERLLEEKEEDLKAGTVDFKEVLAEAIEATPEADPKPESDGDGNPELAVQLTKLLEGVTGLTTKVDEIATAQGEQDKAIKELQHTDDEKIAEKMSPERRPPATKEQPSESKGNEVSEAEAKAKGVKPEDAIKPEDLPDTPGGRALKQIVGAQ